MTEREVSQPAIKVLHLRSSPFVGSPEKLLLAQLRYMQTQDVEYLFGVFDEQLPNENEFASNLMKRGCETFLLDTRLTRFSCVLRTISQRVREHRVDMLCTHDYKSTFYGFVAGLLTRSPVVTVCHGRTTHNIKSRMYEVIENVILKWVHAIVVVSEAMKADLMGYGIAAAKISVITNGIESTQENRTLRGQFRCELGIEDTVPLVVFVGRLSKEKGLYVLIDAVKRVRQDIPSVCVALVGDGPEKHSLHIAIKEAGLTDTVHMMGYRREIDGVLQDMDVLVLPSFREGMPLVILESFSRGKPVVASRVGGIPEVVENNVSGVLVPPGDIDSLANAISAVVLSPRWAKDMGEAGRKCVATSHTVAGQTNNFASLFRTVHAK